jgi:hypothetical protein
MSHVNDTHISVYDYIKDKNNHKNKILLCQQSHRHKHSEDEV